MKHLNGEILRLLMKAIHFQDMNLILEINWKESVIGIIIWNFIITCLLKTFKAIWMMTWKDKMKSIPN
jgi:hypothetical protein